MRRSRIKPVLSAPVRRKAQQDGPPITETDLKQPEKSSEEIESKLTDDSKPDCTEKGKEIESKLSDDSIPNCTVQGKETDSKPQYDEFSTDSIAQKKETESKSPRDKLATDVTIQKKEIVIETQEQIAENLPINEFETCSDTNHTVQIYDTPLLNETTSNIEKGQKVSSSIEGSPAKTVSSRSCFMRPTPRLDGGGRIRRNSIQGSATSGASASESEDDSRKSSQMTPNRISDLTTSTDRPAPNSGVSDGNNSGNINNTGKLNLSQKRRMVVSESARKLAEARREFLLKHENNTPDKSKLTMYDLIYYNPKTNPMKPKPVSSKSVQRKTSVSLDAEEKTEEKEKEEEERATEESSIVPQLKIGPNGEVILDEKSLVIDQYKAQENIDRSEIPIDDDSTGNGFYKKRAKSKDWNKWETMKFYKALNTYGTDFLLMQSVFPKRTRQELKLKYKKEERLNSNLVEKALRYQAFDTEALEKDIASVDESERKEAESIRLIKENSLVSKTEKMNKKKTKRCRSVASEVNCEESLKIKKNSCEEHSSDENTRITITKSKKLRKRILMPIDDSDSDEETLKNNIKTRRKKK